MRLLALLFAATLCACSQTFSASTADGGNDAPLVDAPPSDDGERFPAPLTAASPTRRLVLMDGRTLVLGADNVWLGWGDQLRATFGEEPPSPVQVVARLPLDELTHRHYFGSRTTCRIARDGGHPPQCWGSNDLGQLGVGPPGPPVREPRDILTPTGITYIDPQKQFAWGETGVYQWPFNLRPPGFPPMVDYTPRQVRDRPFCVAAGGLFASAGAFDCESGEIEFEQASEDRSNRVFRPTAPIANVASFATTGGAVLAVLRDGTLRCWGQCALDAAQGSTETTSSFQQVRGMPPIRYVIGRDSASGCAITRQDEVVCWGNCSNAAHLGPGCDPRSRVAPRIGPTRIPQLTDVVELAMSTRHACALTRRRELWCWGAGYQHEIVPEQELHNVYEPIRIDVPNL